VGDDGGTIEEGQTRYAAVGDADVAFQTIGDAPADLLYFYGLGSHLELLRLTDGWNEFLERLVRDLVVGSGIEFDSRGPEELKGVPGTWELLAVRTDPRR
jgi:hypothetical protein